LTADAQRCRLTLAVELRDGLSEARGRYTARLTEKAPAASGPGLLCTARGTVIVFPFMNAPQTSTMLSTPFEDAMRTQRVNRRLNEVT
jgi:hypothetical protein